MSSIFEPAIGPVLRHALTFAFDDLEFRKVLNGRSENYTMRGHAAVYNSLSEDLGGFRELLAPGAFRSALASGPDVRLLFNHDSNKVLARTGRTVDGKPSLELTEDSRGLQVRALIQPRTWVNDLAVEMASGLIDQMSFAFSIGEGGDEWDVQEDDSVIRTIRADGVAGLYDVSVVTYPAYPAAEVGIRELRNAVASGRLPASVLGESAELIVTDSADPDAIAKTVLATLQARSVDEPEASPHDEAVVVEETSAPNPMDDLRAASRLAVQEARERHLQAMKELER